MPETNHSVRRAKATANRHPRRPAKEERAGESDSRPVMRQSAARRRRTAWARLDDPHAQHSALALWIGGWKRQRSEGSARAAELLHQDSIERRYDGLRQVEV